MMMMMYLWSYNVDSLTSSFCSLGYCKTPFHWWSPSSFWGWKTWTYINGTVFFFLVCITWEHLQFHLYTLSMSSFNENSISGCRRRNHAETVRCLRCSLLHLLILSLCAYILLTIAVNNWQTKSVLSLRNKLIPNTGLCSNSLDLLLALEQQRTFILFKLLL